METFPAFNDFKTTVDLNKLITETESGFVAAGVAGGADAGFLWLSVSLDPVDLEKTLARDFGGRDLLSEKCC